MKEIITPKKFDEKYADVLADLALLPKQARGIVGERQEYLKNTINYDEFKMDALWAFKPKIVEKFCRNLGYQYDSSSTQESSSEANVFSGETDIFFNAEAFMEAFLEVINKFDNKVSFCSCLGTEYGFGEKRKRYCAFFDDSFGGLSSEEVSERSKSAMYVAIKEGQRLLECFNGPEEEFEGRLRATLKEQGKSSDLSEENFKYVYNVIRGLNRKVSSEGHAPADGDSDESFAIWDTKKVVETVHGSEDYRNLSSLLPEIVKNWNQIQNITKKSNLDIMKLFMSNGILKELKTREDGSFYPEKPAGDDEFYNYLNPFEQMLFSFIFHMEYINGTFDEDPDDLYDIYEWFFKKGFEFSGKKMAQILGKSNSAISKAKSAYEKIYLPAIKEVVTWNI